MARRTTRSRPALATTTGSPPGRTAPPGPSRVRTAALASAVALAAGLLPACDGTSGGDRPTGQDGRQNAVDVGVVLPSSALGQRFGSVDPRFLESEFAAAGLSVAIGYAQNDTATFRSVADTMLDRGVKVLLTVTIDAAAGRAVYDRARDAGVTTIDYDRLTPDGGADYLVTFDAVEVGRQLGQGMRQCLAARGARNVVVAELNGSPTDPDAVALKRGYDSVLLPLYDAAEQRKGPDQWVPQWSEAEAGAIFAQMLDQQPAIRGVLAANDGLAAAAIEVLRRRGLAGTVPVAGQDAGVRGLRNVLSGDQCMTVWKPIREQAAAAAAIARAAIAGERPPGLVGVRDEAAGRQIPAVVVRSRPIFRDDVGRLIDDGRVARADVCAGDLRTVCARRGL